MKVADTDSKLGRKLETWVVREKKEEAIPKLKRKLENWLTEEERKEQFYVVEEKKRLSRKVLMATNKRLVLFDNNIFGMLKDSSDKIWTQFISVHLTEGVLTSSLELNFFRYYDAPNHKDSVNWVLSALDKEKARECYTYLKGKEMSLIELRRKPAPVASVASAAMKK